MKKKQPLRAAQEPVMKGNALALVGREREIRFIEACLRAQKNVLLEGPVGVGKTVLALEVLSRLGVAVFRIDGDSRYSEQKLAGSFNPTLVLKKGYSWSSFVQGPLVDAMRSGGVLFINEMNRLPEGVQNILLPAMDERKISIPALGQKSGLVEAKPGFRVIATQNPKEFVATTHLSEAVLDRFELVRVDYQTEEEECAIVASHLGEHDALVLASVGIARATRAHEKIRRGASVRAAISIAMVARELMATGDTLKVAIETATQLCLPTRIEAEASELDGGVEKITVDSILAEIVEIFFQTFDGKKKN